MHSDFFLQSWDRRNLFNLWRRSQGRLQKDAVFTDTNKTLFQQRWLSKKLVRAYHGDYIPEKIFKRWYLPQLLPDVRPRKPSSSSPQAIDLSKWANQEEHVSRELKKRERAAELSVVGKKGLAPVGSLMFMEVERRIDVVVFRCCFAHSIYEARRLVVHGRVLLNGKVVRVSLLVSVGVRQVLCLLLACKLCCDILGLYTSRHCSVMVYWTECLPNCKSVLCEEEVYIALCAPHMPAPSLSPISSGCSGLLVWHDYNASQNA